MLQAANPDYILAIYQNKGAHSIAYTVFVYVEQKNASSYLTKAL